MPRALLLLYSAVLIAVIRLAARRALHMMAYAYSRDDAR